MTKTSTINDTMDEFDRLICQPIWGEARHFKQALIDVGDTVYSVQKMVRCRFGKDSGHDKDPTVVLAIVQLVLQREELLRRKEEEAERSLD